MEEIISRPKTRSPKQNIIIAWFNWHFSEAPKNILKIWGNFLAFNFNYFSINTLLKTFFSPWKKIQWSYGRGFDFGRFISTLTSNIISRIIGATVRTFIIGLAFFIEFFILLGGVVVFLFWVFLPFLLILGFWFGIRIIP